MAALRRVLPLCPGGADGGAVVFFVDNRDELVVYRYYALAGAEVGELSQVLARLSPAAPVRSLREGTRAAALRTARTCYDHLAGRLGVAVFTALLDAGDAHGGDGGHHLGGGDQLAARGHEVTYRLSAAGRARLRGIGVDLPDDDQALRYCVDWTEQAHHLSGAVAVPDRTAARPRVALSGIPRPRGCASPTRVHATCPKRSDWSGPQSRMRPTAEQA